MKRISTLLMTVSFAALFGCSDGELALFGGGAEEETEANEQAQAIEDLANNYCKECNAPDGGGEGLWVGINPEHYSCGPFEMAVKLEDGDGLLDDNGDWRVEVIFEVNGHDLFADLPFDAWKFSEDGTRARLVLWREEGLPTGGYHFVAAIIDGEHAADASATYSVECEEEKPNEEEPPKDEEPPTEEPPKDDPPAEEPPKDDPPAEDPPKDEEPIGEGI